MNGNPLLSILMLTCNDGKFLGGCLRSIDEKVSCPFEVILVDNASSEAVPEEILKRYPWLQVIRSESNLGFNAGNNLSAKHARGKYLLLLNVDTILLTDIAPALHLLQSDKSVGVIGAESHDQSGKVRPSTGHFPTAMRLLLFRSLWASPSFRYGPADLRSYRVDWVEGSFLMTTVENWVAIGGFDEAGFLFGNDVNFCKSTVDRGLTVVHCAEVKYIHFGGYEVGRMGHLYAGFRSYHKTFSGPGERRMAEFILRVGLVVRIAAYWLWGILSRDPKVWDKFLRFKEVRRNWARLSP